ncbi:DNA topoisomerase 1 [Caerostris extrusa]|uniref:DNA topoisomerase 1 n=1 Tax=Caerostris extrusa TaxID=172846 RepID=A0AAV4VBQ1_CAEEX|nr:DNA topoisomerase 1 [Caerostris extrusa]
MYVKISILSDNCKEFKQTFKILLTSSKRRKKSEQQNEVDDVIWKQLSHNGPVFAPPYVRVPNDVKFEYSGKPMRLSDEAEEMAGFYGGMLDNENTSKDLFQRNFFKDWRAVMTDKERSIIKDFKKCNFQEFYKYYNMKAD